MSRGFVISAKVPELSKTLSQISAYDGKTLLKIENAVESSGKAIAAGERRRIPVSSGKTKKRIRTRFSRKTITSIIATKSSIAHLLEFGTKAHIILPKKKKVMAIDTMGYRSFRKRVAHPGSRARPFARPAFEDEKPNLIRKLRNAVKNQ